MRALPAGKATRAQGWEGKALLLHPFKPGLGYNSYNSQEQRLCQVEEGQSGDQGTNAVLVNYGVQLSSHRSPPAGRRVTRGALQARPGSWEETLHGRCRDLLLVREKQEQSKRCSKPPRVLCGQSRAQRLLTSPKLLKPQ